MSVAQRIEDEGQRHQPQHQHYARIVHQMQAERGQHEGQPVLQQADAEVHQKGAIRRIVQPF